METRSPELEELLTQGAWVRALARSLVRDPGRADDLAQRAWVAALEREPGTTNSLRQWFAGVLRNLARQERRGEARREARERQADGPQAGAPADELCAALELSRRLAAAVEELDEPYRGAIFRRYYEGLAPRRIAALEGLPLKTVKTRLARGLEQLRARLDREQRHWVAACAPLLRHSKSTLLLGGIAMKLKLACAAGIVLLGVWALFEFGGAQLPTQPVAPADRGDTALAHLDSSASLPGAVRSDAREAAATAPAAAPAAVCPVPHPRIDLTGRVIDAHGLAIGGVRLFLVTPEQALESRKPQANSAGFATVATSDDEGRFTIQPRVGLQILMGERAGLVTLYACDSWSTDGSKPLLLVMAPPIDLAGVVVDEAQQPVAGAEVSFVAGEAVRAGLGVASDTAVEVPWKVRCDAQGRFAIELVASVAGAELRASHASHADAAIPMPESLRRDLRIVLAGREVKLLTGEVRGRDGAPVPDALVGMGRLSTRSDAEGRFSIELAPQSKELGAAKRGRLPARMERPEGGWPEFVTLVLGGEPLTIRGRLLDAEGHPLPGLEVRPVDEHVLGMVSSGVGEYDLPRTLEGIARGSDELETPAFSGRTGEFVVRGLLERDYVLRAFDPRSLRVVESPPLRAGLQSAELRFPADSACKHIAGRALSLGGDPLRGVMLVPSRASPVALRPQLMGEMRTTDSEGRFDFGELATEGLEFQVMGAGLQTLVGWKVPEGVEFDALEVRVARRCRMQVDLADRIALADSVLVLDERGRELELWIEVRGVSSFRLAQPIRDGKSEVLLVAENAALVVLKRQGEEVERQPVHLDPKSLLSVRF